MICIRLLSNWPGHMFKGHKGMFFIYEFGCHDFSMFLSRLYQGKCISDFIFFLCKGKIWLKVNFEKGSVSPFFGWFLKQQSKAECAMHHAFDAETVLLVAPFLWEGRALFVSVVCTRLIYLKNKKSIRNWAQQVYHQMQQRTLKFSKHKTFIMVSWSVIPYGVNS